MTGSAASAVAATAALTSAIAIATDAQAVYQDLVDYANYYCGSDDVCKGQIFEEAYETWSDYYTDLGLEYQGLLSQGACSNPSHPQYTYCGALNQEMGQVYFLLDLIQQGAPGS